MATYDIKALRAKLGLTQQQFATLVGASVKTISNWENGSVIPASKLPQLEKLEIESAETVDQLPDIPQGYTTYLVPLSAMGGSLTGFELEGVKREDCERVISPVAGADLAVPVCGDSMEPEYPNGSRVYVRRINPGDFIAWGNVYVLDTTNGIIIKVVNQSEREDCVKCVSLNPSGRYQPFDVPMRTIRAMYRVLLCVSIK